MSVELLDKPKRTGKSMLSPAGRSNQNRRTGSPNGKPDLSDECLREPERTKLNLARLARQVQLLEQLSNDLNRRVYAPYASEAPESLDNYHGTGIGSLFCSCAECIQVRECIGDEMNGWIIVPMVRFVRRPAKAPTLNQPGVLRHYG